MNVRSRGLFVFAVLLILSDPTAGQRARRDDEAEKTCYKCINANQCGTLSATMNCGSDKLSELGLDAKEKEYLTALKLEDNADLDDPTKYTHCVTVKSDTDKAEFRSCVPGTVADKEICVFIKEMASAVSSCESCAIETAGNKCNNATSGGGDGAETGEGKDDGATTQSGGDGGAEGSTEAGADVPFNHLHVHLAILAAVLFKMLI